MSVIPNQVGRLDPVIEAIRDGDRERARELLNAEQNRLDRKYHAMAVELDRCREACSQVSDFEYEIANYTFWHQARVACGWSGVDGFEGPIETLPVKPALRVQDLYIGQRIGEWRITGFRLWGEHDGTVDVMQINGDESIKLPISFVLSILRHGVEFRLPKGGRNEG